MRIYIIRHGQSEANLDESLHKSVRDEDIKLTQQGQVQAMKTGDWLGGHFAKLRQGDAPQKIRVFSSPFERVRHTRELIMRGVTDKGAEVEIMVPDINLREKSHGVYAGYSEEELRASFSAEYDYYSGEMKAGGERLYKVRPPGGDSYEDIEHNVDKVIPAIRAAEADGVTDLVIVAHSRSNRVLIKQLTGKSVEEFFKDPSQPNASVRMLEINGPGPAVDKGYIFDPGLQSFTAQLNAGWKQGRS